jgi:uncharacterized protein YndB with AHSA1/START domain
MAGTSITQPDGLTVQISRVFDAPRELVWQAWTEPKHMARWFGPKTIANPVCEMDVRPGGRWRIVMHAPDGADYPLKGVFREVVRPERIDTTVDVSEHSDAWHDMHDPGRDRSKGPPDYGLLWIVTFEPEGRGTRLSILNHFRTTALRDSFVKHGMGEGWSGSMDKLADLLAIADR